MQRLHDNAINAAVSGDWLQAISLNKEILSQDANNLDAHLALGFAYMQTNQYEESSRHYRKALVQEPGNLIARNNLDKLSVLKKKTGTDPVASDQKIASSLKEFINIIGKTKVVDLVNIGQSEVLANLKVGQLVELKPKKRRIEVRTIEGEYIGALPDDISKRLLFFIEAQSKYHVYVKSALKNQVEVFLSEDKKGSKVKHFVSFPKNIQDDLKVMMQQLHKDEGDDDKNIKDEDDEDDEEYDEDKGHNKAEEDETDEGITDLEALAADIDEEGHDGFMTDLSAYDEGDEESDE